MDEKPYICRHCKNPLGRLSDAVLRIGAAEFRITVTMSCGWCGARVTWRPAENKSVTRKSVLVSQPA